MNYTTLLTIAAIAAVCHEANRAYCIQLGDDSQVPWEEAPDWQKESCISGVQFCLDNPNAPASHNHEAWVQQKRNDGWVYGETKDPEAKTHPCMVPYGDLPLTQKVKDDLFKGIVSALAPVCDYQPAQPEPAQAEPQPV